MKWKGKNKKRRSLKFRSEGCHLPPQCSVLYQTTTFFENGSSRFSDDFVWTVRKQIKNQLLRSHVLHLKFFIWRRCLQARGITTGSLLLVIFFFKKKLPSQDDKPIENVTYFIFSENNNYATTVTTLQAQGSRLVFCNIVISTKGGGSDR